MNISKTFEILIQLTISKHNVCEYISLLNINFTCSIFSLDYIVSLVFVLYCLWQGFGSHSYWSASFNFHRQCFYPLHLRKYIHPLHRCTPMHFVSHFFFFFFFSCQKNKLHPCSRVAGMSNDSHAEFSPSFLLLSWACSSIFDGDLVPAAHLDVRFSEGEKLETSNAAATASALPDERLELQRRGGDELNLGDLAALSLSSCVLSNTV